MGEVIVEVEEGEQVSEPEPHQMAYFKTLDLFLLCSLGLILFISKFQLLEMEMSEAEELVSEVEVELLTSENLVNTPSGFILFSNNKCQLVEMSEVDQLDVVMYEVVQLVEELQGIEVHLHLI